MNFFFCGSIFQAYPTKGTYCSSQGDDLDVAVIELRRAP